MNGNFTASPGACCTARPPSSGFGSWLTGNFLSLSCVDALNPVVVPFIEILYSISVQAFSSISHISLAALHEVPKLKRAKCVPAGLEGAWGHCIFARVLYVEKCALVLEKRSVAEAWGSWDPWHCPEGPLGWPRDHMPRAVSVQPLAHLHDTAATAAWARRCAPAAFCVWFSCFASARLSGWFVVSVHSVLLVFQFSLCV